MDVIKLSDDSEDLVLKVTNDRLVFEDKPNNSLDVCGVSPKTWSRCFIKYISYANDFYRIPKVVIQQLKRFHDLIMNLAKKKPWNETLQTVMVKEFPHVPDFGRYLGIPLAK